MARQMAEMKVILCTAYRTHLSNLLQLFLQSSICLQVEELQKELEQQAVQSKCKSEANGRLQSKLSSMQTQAAAAQEKLTDQVICF